MCPRNNFLVHNLLPISAKNFPRRHPASLGFSTTRPPNEHLKAHKKRAYKIFRETE